MNIVYKAYETYNGKYVYDRSTNQIIAINDDDYTALSKHDENNTEFIYTINKLRKAGLMVDNTIEIIEHPESSFLEYHINHKTEKITLQMTQNCNLRCSYCTYSGNYENRTHSNKIMSEDIIYKCIDYLMSHSDEVEEVNIGFYGGEPLLQKADIFKCINYISNKYSYRKVSYSITTNGTLLDDDIIDFLVHNNIDLTISLDGPKEIQDSNRRTVNGEGTFDKIMYNLKRIKLRYPEYSKRILFNTVLTPNKDFDCINNFFSSEDIFGENSLMRGMVRTNNSKKEIEFEENYYIVYKAEMLKLLLWMLKRVKKDKVAHHYLQDEAKIKNFCKEISEIKGCSKISHPGGPCIPGGRRLFVDVYGNLYPCERVSETSPVMKIGNIYDGVDIDKARRLLNIGELSSDECKSCWNFNFCQICCSNADGHDCLSKQVKMEHCAGMKESTIGYMKIYSLLKENNYDFDEELYSSEELNI